LGIFSTKKRENKIYSLKEAMKLLQTNKYQNYTTIPEGEGYRLVPMQQLVQVVQEQEENTTYKTGRHGFLYRMKKGVVTHEYSKAPDQYGYQTAKEYRQSQGITR